MCRTKWTTTNRFIFHEVSRTVILHLFEACRMQNACVISICFVAKHDRSTAAENAAHWFWAKVSSFSCHAILIAYANTCSISHSLFITHHSEHVYGSKLKQENRRNRVFKSIKTGFVSTQMCNLWSFSHPAFFIVFKLRMPPLMAYSWPY